MTIEHRENIRIEAPPAKVWAVCTDVERWPEWTPAMQRIERLEEGPLAPGSRARIEANGAPASVWTVTEHTEARSFTWETTARGVNMAAWHVIEADNGGSKVELGVRMTGLMATLLSPFLRRLARRNVGLEAEGLKRRCEA